MRADRPRTSPLRQIRADVNRQDPDQVFVVVGLLVMFSALLVLAVLFVDLVQQGAPRLNLDFLQPFPSRKAERAGDPLGVGRHAR